MDSGKVFYYVFQDNVHGTLTFTLQKRKYNCIIGDQNYFVSKTHSVFERGQNSNRASFLKKVSLISIRISAQSKIRPLVKKKFLVIRLHLKGHQ
jgi:hypothetical protein